MFWASGHAFYLNSGSSPAQDICPVHEPTIAHISDSTVRGAMLQKKKKIRAELIKLCSVSLIVFWPNIDHSQSLDSFKAVTLKFFQWYYLYQEINGFLSSL